MVGIFRADAWCVSSLFGRIGIPSVGLFQNSNPNHSTMACEQMPWEGFPKQDQKLRTRCHIFLTGELLRLTLPWTKRMLGGLYLFPLFAAIPGHALAIVLTKQKESRWDLFTPKSVGPWDWLMRNQRHIKFSHIKSSITNQVESNTFSFMLSSV